MAYNSGGRVSGSYAAQGGLTPQQLAEPQQAVGYRPR